MGSNTPAERCIRAMSYVYGHFESLSDEDCKRWVPPSDPGVGGHHGRRLWADAFGVLNFTSLFVEAGKKRYLTLAERLVQTVHEILGRTRDGSRRLPGATDMKPLLGGLRSGKLEEAEDGQVHRDLTMWMFALDRLGRVSADARWNSLAAELGEAVHPRFTVHKLSGGMRLVGKISGDMADVVEVKTGEVDAVMGWAVFRRVREGGGGAVLGIEVEDYERVMESMKGSGGSEEQKKEEEEEEVKWLGMGLWVASLWKEEAWSKEMMRRGLGNVERLFKDASRTLGQKEGEEAGDKLESRAVKELGACLGVRCWAEELENGDGMMESTERVVKVWEGWLEKGELDGEEVRGVVSCMVGTVVMARR